MSSSPTISFVCQECGAEITTDCRYAGAIGECPACGQAVSIPKPVIQLSVASQTQAEPKQPTGPPMATTPIRKASKLTVPAIVFGVLILALLVFTNLSPSGPAPGANSQFWPAAQRGDGDAQCKLGLSLLRGDGVVLDQKEGVKWLTKSAEQGNSFGEYNLANCYAKGDGVEKDPQKMAAWLQKAGSHGLDVAQFFLGAIYQEGSGVQKDPVESAKWYRKAAEQGHPDAQCKLGSYYLTGVGVTQSDREGAGWFRRAADQGKPEAQYILAGLYVNGVGVPPDKVIALKWLNLAATSREPEIVDYRDQLAQTLSAQEVEAAERAAIEWNRGSARGP